MEKRVIESPIGPLGLYAENGKIVLIGFADAGTPEDDSPVLLRAEKELMPICAFRSSKPWRCTSS